MNLAPWARKAATWDAPLVTDEATLEAITDLLIFPAGEYPLDDFAGERPRYFIARLLDGRRFLVNTEGYNYARYIVALT
jgi:hypothetical protein